MNPIPLVSVLMTAYNREKYIAEAIESVIASSYSNWELIIVDDQSKDGTVAIASKYAKQDSRIKLYVNEHNLGDYPNRNRAAGYALGDMLMTVDSDDKLYENSMEKCVTLFNKFPNTFFGICNKLPSDMPVVLDSATTIHNHFFKEPILMNGPGGTILQRQFFNQIGGYPEKYGPANDMYFNLKAATKTRVLLIPFDIIFYRRHEGQQINNVYSYLYNNYNYLRDALNELNLLLEKKQIDWLVKKNKRRFSINVTRYFFRTLNFSKTVELIRLTGFSIKDFIQGIFH